MGNFEQLRWRLPAADPAAHEVVLAGNAPAVPLRLSPFSRVARQAIRDIYRDLAVSTPLEGVLFGADAFLTPSEDSSRQARARYARWGLPPEVSTINDNPAALARWSVLKSNLLNGLAKDLAKVIDEEQPGLQRARLVSARVALSDQATEELSQRLDSSMHSFDYVVISLGDADEPSVATNDYDAVFNAVRRVPGGPARTVFELDAQYEQDAVGVDEARMKDMMGAVLSRGGRNVSLYLETSLEWQASEATRWLSL